MVRVVPEGILRFWTAGRLVTVLCTSQKIVPDPKEMVLVMARLPELWITLALFESERFSMTVFELISSSGDPRRRMFL